MKIRNVRLTIEDGNRIPSAPPEWRGRMILRITCTGDVRSMCIDMLSDLDGSFKSEEFSAGLRAFADSLDDADRKPKAA